MNDRLKIDKRLLAVNSASSLLSWALKVFILFWLQRYLLSRISHEEYSLYPIVASVMVFVGLVEVLLAGGVRRFIVEADARGDQEKVTRIASTMVVIQSAAGLVIFAAGMLFSWYIGVFLNIDPRFLQDARLMMALMIATFVFQLSTVSLEVGLYVRQKFVLMHGIELATIALRILALLALFRYVGVRVLWIVVTSSLATMVSLAIKILISRRLIPALRFRIRAIDWRGSRELLSFGFWHLLQVVASRIHSNLDPLILNRLAGSTDVTSFFLGAFFYKHINNAIAFITEPFAPAVISLHARGEHDRLRGIFYRYGRLFIWAYMLFALPLVVFRRDLMLLWLDGRYMQAAAVMMMLFGGSFFNLGTNFVYKLSRSMGRIKPLSLRAIAIQTVNIGLTLLLVGRFKMGAIGAALSSFLVYFAIKPFTDLTLAHQLLGITFGEYLRKTVVPGYLPVLAAAGVFLGIRTLDAPDNWFKLFAYSAAGELAYLALLYPFMQETEKRFLATVLSRVKGRLALGRGTTKHET